jgi:hypothetical protein
MPASHPWLAERKGWGMNDLSRFVREVLRTNRASSLVTLYAGITAHKARQEEDRL